MEQTTVSKLPKNQFRCFHCRGVYPSRNGSWFDWSQMQVHLCDACAKKTTERAERKVHA